MKAGETLTLTGAQAEYFVRGRTGVGDQTNISRLARQRVYMHAAAEVLMEKSAQSAGFANGMYQAVEPYLVTDMSKGRLINLANSISKYEILPMTTIDGEAVVGSYGAMEFYPDEDSLTEAVVGLFFEPEN